MPASTRRRSHCCATESDTGHPPFDGPVFTDDLSSMKAITDRYGVAEAVLKALQAGEDTALWITTTEVLAVLDRLQSALAAGELSLPKIEASVLNGKSQGGLRLSLRSLVAAPEGPAGAGVGHCVLPAHFPGAVFLDE